MMKEIVKACVFLAVADIICLFIMDVLIGPLSPWITFLIPVALAMNIKTPIFFEENDNA